MEELEALGAWRTEEAKPGIDADAVRFNEIQKAACRRDDRLFAEAHEQDGTVSKVALVVRARLVFAIVVRFDRSSWGQVCVNRMQLRRERHIDAHEQDQQGYAARQHETPRGSYDCIRRSYYKPRQFGA
jgi:hypothetical protein